MSDLMDRREAIVTALESADYDVVDTFGALREGKKPRFVLELDELGIAGERYPAANLTVAVRQGELTAESVEVTDEGGLTDAQRETLDEVSGEKHAGPDLTLWVYDPDADVEDQVDEVMADVREKAEGVSA